jgi:dipeptidyl aminopeptidase/acylaminoacyl peptidase
VWQQSDGTRENLYANRFNGTSWGTAELIEADNAGNAQYPQIAFDSSDNAIAVWQQSDGTRRYSIYANRFNGTSWGTAELLETDNAGNVQYPQIAFDSSGNAIAVWRQSDGTRYNIYANRFNGTSWGTAELLETDNAGNAQYPQIAFDSSGNAIAVWRQFDGITDNIWANRFDGTSWGTAELIETDAGSAIRPQIAIDSSDNAIAVWLQRDGTRDDIYANRFNGTSWGTAELIEADNAGNVDYPQIAFDSSGNAIAVWKQSDGTRYNIYANRFD